MRLTFSCDSFVMEIVKVCTGVVHGPRITAPVSRSKLAP